MAYTEQEIVNLFYADIIYNQTNYTARNNKFFTNEGRNYTVQSSRNNVYKIHAVIDGQYSMVKVKDTDGAIKKKLTCFKGQVFPRQLRGAGTQPPVRPVVRKAAPPAPSQAAPSQAAPSQAAPSQAAQQAPAVPSCYFSAGPAPEVYKQTDSGLVYDDNGTDVPVRQGKYGMEEDPYRINYGQTEEKQPLAVRYDREKEQWVPVESEPKQESVKEQPKQQTPMAEPEKRQEKSAVKILSLRQECREIMKADEGETMDLGGGKTMRVHRTNTLGSGDMIITAMITDKSGVVQKIKYEIDVNSRDEGSIITKTYYNDAAGTKAEKKEKILYGGEKAEIM